MFNNKQKSWQIVYSNFTGIQRRAIEFLNTELSKYLLRSAEACEYHTLPILKQAKNLSLDKNAIILSTYEDSLFLPRYIKKEEVPQDGYLLKVIDNPTSPQHSLVLITATKEQALFYGAVAFIDKYVALHGPFHNALYFSDKTFDEKMKPATITSSHKTKNRGVFAWGHPINDYRAYIKNMARLGLNRLILWNDFKPLNADEIVEYAHSYGIKVLWGFAWGWTSGHCDLESIDDEFLQSLKKQVICTFEQNYANLGDGLYFQSFTERTDDKINGKSVASTVTRFVNDTASELLSKYPNLQLEFGLHAMSVKNSLNEIANIDKRVNIIWEDAGCFPYSYSPDFCDEEKFSKALEITKKFIELRGNDAPVGFMFKGFSTIDWSIKPFSHQRGPFILGEASNELSLFDKKMRGSQWRNFSADWIKNGDYARRLADFINNQTNGNAQLYMAEIFDDNNVVPYAVCSEIFWNADRSYEQILNDTLKKNIVTFN